MKLGAFADEVQVMQLRVCCVYSPAAISKLLEHRDYQLRWFHQATDRPRGVPSIVNTSTIHLIPATPSLIP